MLVEILAEINQQDTPSSFVRHTPEMTIALAGGGSSNVDLEIAAAGNTEVMRAKMKTMGMLGLNDIIDDILITLGEQYHLLRPLQKHDGLFLYHVLDKSKSNLALARRALREAEKNLV